MTDRNPPVLRPEHPSARPLGDLVASFGLDHDGDIASVDVSGVSLDSESVQPGDLYVGMPGAVRHGAQFAERAAERGAVAVLTDEAGRELAAPASLPVLIVPSPREALGAISAWVYRTDDDLPTLFGVTGTNGKTSTCHLLDGILRQLGLATGLSTTAERRVRDETISSRLTTPEASEVHGLLARMREAEVRAVSLEVSAQAITRHRVDGIVFDVVAFTNLSHDHLDDYADMEEYFQAKEPLFQPERARRGVISLDTEWGERLAGVSRIPFATVALRDDVEADWRIEILDERPQHTEFRLSGPDGRHLTTRVPLIGRHMAANAGLAIVMLVESGFDLAAIDQALDADGGIRAHLPGRTERVSGDRGPSLFVDFGHSPDAFLHTLSAVRNLTADRVVMVFGASGDRDTTKRFDMGRIAAEHADVLVVTDHHSRSEDPAQIRRAIVEGAAAAGSSAEIHEIVPPEDAIRFAVSLAREGDSILWAGPGHLDYREVAGVKVPFDARELARDALREAGW